ncbi:MAG TPA: M48 family metallopeptidase [Anaerolineae bacterium]|nr:M48 family metallopeptidase [Anaerolineae bacterium]HMR65600.1 M48 family metallopeptidase [Anaerolineae bacterium]
METKIIRSHKRKRSVSAKVVDGVFQVSAPAHISETDLQPIIENLKKRWEKRQVKNELDDKALQGRAQELNRQYFDGQLKWKSIRWVTNQDKRFGSCTPGQGTIRLSHRLATMPAFVRDYVIVHELAHLIEANHSPKFWKLVNRYPKTERARGYLMAVGLENLEE